MKTDILRLFVISLLVVLLFDACKKSNKQPPPSASITSISPDNGVWSTIVTIRGSNFSGSPADNEVKFNGVDATITAAASDALTVTVPKGAGSGPVTVKVGAGAVIEGPVFNYSYITSVTTLAGTLGGAFADGDAAVAKFNKPWGVSTDVQGNVYVADLSNRRIRKITPSGVVGTLAGSTFGFADGNGASAQFASPWAICSDAQGNLYVSDLNNYKIRKITPSGVVSTIAGSTKGYVDGNGAAAKFDAVVGICVDPQGNLYVTEEVLHIIRKITPSGVVSTLAGSTEGYENGNLSSAKFDAPRGICIDKQGNLYVADAGNSRIRKITPAGVVSTLAGSTGGYADGAGVAARFQNPSGICIDALGNLYVTDIANHKVRKITPDGMVSTYAGSTRGYMNGSPLIAQFAAPYGIAVDAQNNVYVADTDNSVIRKIVAE